MTMNVAQRAAEVVDSFHDEEEAAEIVNCLMTALGTVITLAAHNKADALRVADAVLKDMKRDIRKNFQANRALHEERFGTTQ